MLSDTSSGRVDHVQPLEPRRLLSLTPVGPEVTVPMPTEMSRFDMAVADNGSFIVVGDPIEQPDSPDVIAIRYSASGQQIGTPLTLDNHGFDVSVAMDSDGDAVVAYRKSSGGLYVVRASKAGEVTAPQLIATGSISETVVSVDAAGGFFVGWLDDSNFSVHLRAFNPDGTPRAAAFEPEERGGLDSYGGLLLAAKPDGSGAVYGLHHFVEGDVHVDLGLVSAGGVTGNVPTGPIVAGGSSAVTDIDVYPDGSFVVGFLGVGEAPPLENGVGRETFAGFAQRFDATGATIGTPIRLGESLPGSGVDQRITSVTIDTMPDGGFIAAFQQGADAGITTYVRRYNADVVSIDGPLVVDTDPPRGHVISADANGGAVLAYLQGAFSEIPTSEPESGTIHFRRLVAASSALKGADLFVNGTEGNDHIIIERVRNNVFVNVNGIVERFNAADVQFLSISGLGGDDDVVNATSLPSTISGGDGDDTLWGGTGADNVRGYGGNDSLRGGDGNDVLLGGTGDDTLHGGDGNDTLTGERGSDTLRFGELNDGVIAGITLVDSVLTVVGSDADDEILIQHGGAGLVAVTVNGVTTSYPFELVGVPVIFGNGGNDILTVRIPFSLIDGGAGDDELSALSGRDTLLGGDGNDHLTAVGDRALLDGGLGADTLITLEGENTLFTDDGFPDTVHGGGFERVDADSLDELIDVELVT